MQDRPNFAKGSVSVIDTKWAMFLQVAQRGSLTLAAADLGCLQSVLSRQISTLETQCGNKLFRRTGRGVELTAFGELLLIKIRPIFVQAEQFADDVRTTRGEPMGEVRLGLLPSKVQCVAGPLLKALRDRHPLIKLHFTDGTSAHLEEWLHQGRLDLSLLLREDSEENPDEPSLCEVFLHLIGLPEDPVTTRESVPFASLEALPLILPASPHLLRTRLDALAKVHGVRLTAVIEADSVLLQQELVAAGGGYSIVASNTARSCVSTGRLSSSLIVDPSLPRRVVLGSTKLRPSTLAVREVARMLYEMRHRIGEG